MLMKLYPVWVGIKHEQKQEVELSSCDLLTWYGIKKFKIQKLKKRIKLKNEEK